MVVIEGTQIVSSASTSAGVSRAKSRPTLPVQQTTKVELIINLKTAKALGGTKLLGPRPKRSEGERRDL